MASTLGRWAIVSQRIIRMVTILVDGAQDAVGSDRANPWDEIFENGTTDEKRPS
jgi:hypothetical protein